MILKTLYIGNMSIDLNHSIASTSMWIYDLQTYIYIYEFKWFTQQIVNLASWTIQAKKKIGFKSQVPFNKCTVLGLNGYVRCYKWGLSWDSGKLDEWHYSRVFYIKKKGGGGPKKSGSWTSRIDHLITKIS